MSENEHQSLIKTPKQLIAVGVLAVIIPVFGAVMLASFVVTSSKQSGTAQSMDPEAVARRIKPVADVVIGQAAGPAAAAGTRSGEEVYKAVCMACHGAGVAGAPKFGDKAGWAARIAGGQKKLVSSGIKGVRAMPPKGGGADLSDAEFERAVVYLINSAGGNFKDPAPPKGGPAKAAK